MSTQLTKIEKAQSRLLFKLMFLAMVMLTTPLIQTTKVKRAATDMKRIYWNEEFFATLDVKLVMFVLAHEVMHIILKHGLRQGHRDHKSWNIACDHVINLLLEEHGFTLWKDCCCDKRFKGMSEEQVYAILEQEQSQGGTISPDALGEDLTQSEDTDVNDPTVRAEIENQIDRMVAGAMAQAKLAGSMPAGLAQLLEGVINPPLHWFYIFSDYMRRTIKEDESWKRRNRALVDFIMPGRSKPGMGGIGLIGDTSASMKPYRIWPQVSEEMRFMLEEARPEFIQVIWADYADFSHEQRFEPGDWIDLEPYGGGGTDMRLPLKRMEDYEVDVCVLVTDAETPWPAQPTPFPLIVLTTTDQAVPAWATKIRIR